MKKFLAIYIGTAAALEKSQWKSMDEGKRKALEASGIKAWMDWGTVNSAAIVDQGSPLGKTKRASREGITDIKNSMTGYVIVEAASHEAAASCLRIIRTSRSSPAIRLRSWSACRFRSSEIL